MAADRGAKVHLVRSSLPYQIILYLNGWYFGFFAVCELLMFVYKGETLAFPPHNLAAEIILIFLLAGIEALRLFFGKKGNLTERAFTVILSLALSVMSIFGNLYILLWQTYVLRAELILVAIELAFIGIELLLGLIAIILFMRATPY